MRVKSIAVHVSILAAFTASTLALWACSSGTGSETGDDQNVTAGTHSEAMAALAGTNEDKHQQTQDFGSLVLKADGTYTAKVLARVTGATILCNHAPCNAPEAGKWTLIPRQIRFEPKDGKARTYLFNKVPNTGE